MATTRGSPRNILSELFSHGKINFFLMTELLAKNSANSCTNAVKSVTKDLETLSDSNPVGPLRQPF